MVQRFSLNSLYDKNSSSFNEISKKLNQIDSNGFIKINSLRLTI
ncbi:hypothetical protein AB8Q20_00695 [Candidatus Carsonella ruddii]